MRKLLLLTLLFLFVNASLMAQATPPRVQIIQGSDTIPPVKNGTVNTVTVKLKIQLVGAYDTANADKNKVVFKIQQGTLSIKPIFVPIGTDSSITSYSVPASAWPNSNSPTQTEVELHLQVPGGAAIGNDEIGKIVIAGFDESFYSIVLSNNAEPIKTAYNPNKPFWVEIGSNFDFLEGLQANNPFFGVFFHKRDIRPFCKNASILENNAHKNVGVFAGVFESKTISTNQTEDFFSRLYFNNTSFIPGKPDSIRVFRDAGKYATKRSIRNIGLFFSPQLRLSKGSSNVDGLHFFVSFWAELQWQQITQENDFSQLVRIDSTIIGLNQLDTFRKGGTGIFNNQKTVTDIRTHYLGFGLPIYFRENNAQLFVNPVFGWSNQPGTAYLAQSQKFGIETTGLSREWKPFYAIQFRLNEEKYGIAFSGEVRGLFAKNNPPFVSLALTKKFDLTKFLEFK